MIIEVTDIKSLLLLKRLREKLWNRQLHMVDHSEKNYAAPQINIACQNTIMNISSPICS